MSSEWIEPIAKLYIDRVIRESDIQDHMPRLKVMVEQLMPINIIELGTREGYSTVAFLMALRTRPHAHLYSVDLERYARCGHELAAALRAGSRRLRHGAAAARELGGSHRTGA